jgi:Ni,Fe-hydrogenase maturation factor
LTEPACGVSVQVAYNLKKYINKNYSNVVVVVCGGSGTKLESLIEMKNQFIL